ncbi:MAG: VanZ family protein [Deltaproteobacteria bacterium]|nr:VanZ family protein [Deltaproteobacteria bacterium]
MHTSWKDFFTTWCWVICYCSCIFTLSSRSNLDLPRVVPEADKVAHSLEYVILEWLCSRSGQIEWSAQSLRFIIVLATLFSSAYGASDEWH